MMWKAKKGEKMPYDIKKEWPRLKKELIRVSQEAVDLAKKGEKELVKITQTGKMHVDSTALTLKKEHLLYLIGKEYVQAKCPCEPTSSLKKLLNEVDHVDKQMASLKKKMKGKGKGSSKARGTRSAQAKRK